MWKYVVSAIGGFAIAFFIFGGKADVSTTKDEKLSKTSTQLDTNINKKVGIEATGVKEAIVFPDGSYSLRGDDLSFKLNSEEISTLKLRVQELEKKLSHTKTISYSGSVYVLWEPFNLKYTPSVIGVSYLIFNPLELCAEYNLDYSKLYIGPKVKF